MGERLSRWVEDRRECLVFEIGDNVDLSHFGIPYEPVWTISAKRYTPEGDVELLGFVGRVPDPAGARGAIESWLRDRGYWGDTGPVLPWALLGDNGSYLDGQEV